MSLSSLLLLLLLLVLLGHMAAIANDSGLSLQTEQRAWSARLSVGHVREPCEMAEPIEMPFRGLTPVDYRTTYSMGSRYKGKVFFGLLKSMRNRCYRAYLASVDRFYHFNDIYVIPILFPHKEVPFWVTLILLFRLEMKCSTTPFHAPKIGPRFWGRE